MGIIISTDRLVSSSEARQKFGKLLDEIQENEKNYFVILENGKVTALLVHPHILNMGISEESFDLEKLRREWSRYTKEAASALEKLETKGEKELPLLLR